MTFKKIFISSLLILFLFSFSCVVKAKHAIEIDSLRTINSKTYDIGNNLYRTDYYDKPIHYLQDLKYHDFDERFIKIDGQLKTNKSNYHLTIPEAFIENQITLDYLSLSSFDFKINENYDFRLLSYSRYDEKLDKCYSSNAKYVLDDNILDVNINTKDTLFSFYMNKYDSEFSFSLDCSNLVLNQYEGYFELLDYGITIYRIYKANIKYIVNDEEINASMDFDICDGEISFYMPTICNIEPTNMTIDMLVENCLSLDLPISRDKYITIGENGFIDNNEIKVGIDPLTTLTPSGQFVNYEYRGIIEVKLPPLTSIESAELNITKKIVNNNPLYNPNVYLYKITSHSYDQITSGSINYTKSLVDSDYYYNTTNTFDITNLVSQSLQNNIDILVFELKGVPSTGSTGFATYHSFESTNGSEYTPFLTLESYDITSSAGAAPSYGNGNNDPNTNCFAYALNQVGEYIPSYDGGFGTTEEMRLFYYYNYFIPETLNNIRSHNYEARIISGYDGLIFNYERRICFAIHGTATGYSFHFIKQVSTGAWACKHGVGETELFDINLTPDDDIVWNNNQHTYLINTPVTYLAIY